MLGSIPGGPTIRVVADSRRFRDILLAERPRLVVVAEPPAEPSDLALVADERRRRARLRLVHLAPADSPASRHAALALGFDALLDAAMAPEALVARLLALDDHAPGPAGHTTRIAVADGLELDLAARVLRRGSVSLHLRPKEFGLLAVLAANPGRVFTRRELLDRVWGGGPSGASRTVDVHVRWLRAKIEPDPHVPRHLLTAHGAGYRFEAPQR
jgi:two-component system response regulator RegX3